jgi:hypothetical protein
MATDDHHEHHQTIPIRNDDDLHTAFKRLELVFQAQAGIVIALLAE